MCSCYTAPDANLQRSINEDFWDARLNYGQMWDTEQDETIWTCGPGKHKMLSKLATQSFNILRLIARNPNFLRPKVPYFNVSRLSRLQMAQKWPKMTQNGPKWPKYDPKWPKMAQRGPRMTQNGPKMTQYGPKLPQMAQK